MGATTMKAGMVPKSAPSPAPQSTTNVNSSSNPDEYLKQFKEGGTSATAVSFVQDPVYWGQYEPEWWIPPSDPGSHPEKAPRSSISADEAASDIYNWSDEERNAFAKRLYHAGIIDNPSSWAQMEAAWRDAVAGSAKLYATGRYVTPWQVVDMWEGLGDPSSRNPERKTTTSTSYNIPSAQEAEAMVKTIFKEKVGRDPTDGELSRYRSMVVSKAKANPSVTTVTVDRNGNQTSSTSGGIDLQSVAGDAVEQDDDYGVYQAATTYYGALQSMLGAVA